jgi:hypothetical protein
MPEVAEELRRRYGTDVDQVHLTPPAGTDRDAVADFRSRLP